MSNETKLIFTNKTIDNNMYEWGRNCATLRYNTKMAMIALEDYLPEKFVVDDVDMFWKGFKQGPRETNEIHLIHPFSN